MDLSLNSLLGGAKSGRSPAARERVEQLLSQRWVIVVVNLVAMALLTASFAHWTWKLVSPEITPATVALSANADGAGDYNVQSLVSANLFGQTAATEQTLDSIPLSSLNLILTGVMAALEGGIAFISSNNGPEAPYTVGQDIVSGAVLEAVYADRVLIRRAGGSESLILKETATALPGDAIIAMPVEPGDIVTETGRNNFSIQRGQIDQQLQRPDFLRQAHMVPNAGGGFLVRTIQPGSLYEKLGLRTGDVINTVNGQPVNSMVDVVKMYQQLGNGQAGQITLDVRRAGKNESLQYNLQ